MTFHRVIEIETRLFRGVAPRPDIINEMIGGDELAGWLHGRLVAKGLQCGTTHAADHGWDFPVTSGGKRYLVVCSCDFEAEDAPAESHIVQVAQQKGEAVEPDPVLEAVRHALAAAAGIEIVSDEPRRR